MDLSKLRIPQIQIAAENQIALIKLIILFHSHTNKFNRSPVKLSRMCSSQTDIIQFVALRGIICIVRCVNWHGHSVNQRILRFQKTQPYARTIFYLNLLVLVYDHLLQLIARAKVHLFNLRVGNIQVSKCIQLLNIHLVERGVA